MAEVDEPLLAAVEDAKNYPDLPEEQRYLVLRQFVSHEGTHYIGERLRPGVDKDWGQIQSLVGAGLIYPVADEETYSRLPAHVFNAVKTLQELEGIIAVGENPVTFTEWEKSAEVLESERLAQAQLDSMEENQRLQAKRAGEQHKIAMKPFVEARPVVVVHPIPAIDSMREEAKRAGSNSNSDEAERGDEIENQDEHAMGTPPEHQVQVSNERDGADVTEQIHTPNAERSKEGPDADEATTVVPSTDDGEESRGPTRSYEDLSLKALQDELENRGLSKTGNKAELRQRLQNADDQVT